MKIKTYQEALDFIFFVETKKDPTLFRIKKALHSLGNPQDFFSIIHIAGTNGKGSVCKMCFSILKKAGISVGCYTGPHFIDVEERYVSNNGNINQELLIEFCNKIITLDIKFSYGEKYVLIAMLYFKKIGVDYAIVEVGNGGIHDVTNFVNPVITAITSIGYDHIALLGNTLEEISYHKAGIIKEGIPIVYNHVNQTIYDVAKEKAAIIFFTQKKLETNLKGEHQRENAGISYEICKYVLGDGSEDIIKKGLLEVEHLGRLQYLSNNLLIDGAHNAQGLKGLKRYINSISKDYTGIQLCISQKKRKTGDTILEEFHPEYKNFILVDSPKHSVVERVTVLEEELYRQESDLFICNKKAEDIITLAKENTDTLYVVFGSLYILGDFYNLVSNKKSIY